MIQVENPLAILTQDTARAFLSSSTPEMKYDVSRGSGFLIGVMSDHSSQQLFLKGTGLKQLKEDYDHINKLISMTQTMLERKRLVITLKSYHI